MKWIFILLAFISTASFGQDDPAKYIKLPNTYGQRMPRFLVDSVFGLPLRDTNFTPQRAGTLVMRPADKIVYRFDGTIWIGLGSSPSLSWGSIIGTLSSQTDLQNALNLKFNSSRISTYPGLGTSDDSVSSTKAVKAYVDALVSSTAIPDGDKGDVDVTGGGLIWNVDTGAINTLRLANLGVTNAKINDVAWGKVTGITGTPNGSKFLRDDGSWQLVPGLTSFNGRTGVVVPETNDYTWGQINKTTSSLGDLTTRSASDLSSGTLPAARFGPLTGDVTTSGYVATIAPLAITDSKVSDVSWSKITGAPAFNTGYIFTASDFNETGSTVSIDYTNGQKATNSIPGFLTAADHTTFLAKQNAITLGTPAQYFRGDLSLATMPTALSSFTNDAGFITASSSNTLTNKTWNGIAIGDAYISSAATWNAKQAALSNLGSYYRLFNGTAGFRSLRGINGVLIDSATTGAITLQMDSALYATQSDLNDAVIAAGGGVTSVSGTLNRVTSSGGTTPIIDISASYIGQPSISTVGTLTTAVYQGTVIAGQYGGTGVANTGKTVTLGGNLTTSGAFATTFTSTATTNVTLPTTGTLATLAGSEALTNKSVNGVTLVTGGTGTLYLSQDGTYSAPAGGGSGSVNSGVANRLAYYPSTGTAVDDLAAITASRALVSDANGLPIASSVTSATLAFLDVTSSVQSQINGKQANISLTTTGTGAATFISNVLNIPTPSGSLSLSNVGSQYRLYNGSSGIKTLRGYNGVLIDSATSNTISLQVDSTVYVTQTQLTQSLFNPPPLALSDASTINWDWEDGAVAYVTIGGNRSLSITNVPDGQSGIIIVTQDGTGGRTLSLTGQVEGVLKTGAGDKTVVGFVKRGSTLYWSIDNQQSIGGGGGTADYPPADVEFIVSSGQAGQTTISLPGTTGWKTRLFRNGILQPTSISTGNGTYSKAGETLTLAGSDLVEGEVIQVEFYQTATANDSDADAYFARIATAGGSISDADKVAYTAWVVNAKAAGYYSKLKAFYPYLGGNTASRQLNSISSSYTQNWTTITFTGGSGGGVSGNGSTSFINTNLNPQSVFSTENMFFGCVVVENTAADVIEMGAYESLTAIANILVYAAGDNFSSGPIGSNGLAAAALGSGASGIWGLNRSSNTSLKLYRNGSTLATNTGTETGVLPNLNFYILGRNSSGNVLQAPSPKTHKADYIGDPITDAEWSSFVSNLSSFLTAIGR